MIRVSFGGPDYPSIRFLKQWPRGFYISPLVDNFDQAFQQFFVKQYFENGAALFGRESAHELQLVREWARGHLRNATDAEVSLIVHYFVQRVRNYTHIGTLAAAHLDAARVVSDECRTDGFHSRRLVDVVKAEELVRWFKTLSLFEYGQWVYGKDHGFPPFDLECRCRMDGVVPGV